jgi:hypothetical protein
MIFPQDYKTVGIAREERPKDPIYFATEYLISYGDGISLHKVQRLSPGTGFMRPAFLEPLAQGGEIVEYPAKIDTRNRAKLIQIASNLCHDGVNTVIFKGPDEHVTFIHQPDLDAIREIEVLDVSPPDPPWLVYVLERLEECGVIGDLTVKFRHRILDLRTHRGEMVYFPCKASGLGRSLDCDKVAEPRPKIVGCEISKEIFKETYPAKEFDFKNICPVSGGVFAPTGPFITRCCKSERRGPTAINGHPGVVVHWGDGPYQVAEAIRCLVGNLLQR